MSHGPSVLPWKGCLAKGQLDVDKVIALGCRAVRELSTGQTWKEIYLHHELPSTCSSVSKFMESSLLMSPCARVIVNAVTGLRFCP